MKKKFGMIFLIFMILVIYMPILILVFYSFTDATSIGTIGEFSLQNYITLFTREDLTDMIKGTLILAFGSAALATILGTLGAIGSFYSKKWAQFGMGMLNQIPVVNADVVTGFSICILMIVVIGVDKSTFLPLVIGHVVLCTPFVYLSVMPKLKTMDNSIYEAAMDLGATPASALIKAVLPQIIPGVISGFALSVTLSMDDYFITSYTKPATFDTISTYVVNATKGNQTEIKTALWALASIIFLFVIMVVVIMNVTADRREKGTGEDEHEA